MINGVATSQLSVLYNYRTTSYTEIKDLKAKIDTYF